MPIAGVTVDEISHLARALLDADAEVLIAEQQLKARKEAARVLREETIPAMMQELGLQSLQLSSGATLTVKPEVYCSIPKDPEGKDRAFRWLVENGASGIIKSEVAIEFPREELQRAAELVRTLEEQGFTPTLSQNVHSQTLKAFIREQLAESQPIDLALFGAHVVDTAKIK